MAGHNSQLFLQPASQPALCVILAPCLLVVDCLLLILHWFVIITIYPPTTSPRTHTTHAIYRSACMMHIALFLPCWLAALFANKKSRNGTSRLGARERATEGRRKEAANKQPSMQPPYLLGYAGRLLA